MEHQRNGSKGRDLRTVIADLNPILRGWGAYFRTGNAARSFNQIDTYVYERLKALHLARQTRRSPAHRGQGVDMDARLLRQPRTPSPARHRQVSGGHPVPLAREPSRKPCAGKPHARFPRGSYGNSSTRRGK
jgi:RNA-directed DNA polymerase